VTWMAMRDQGDSGSCELSTYSRCERSKHAALYLPVPRFTQQILLQTPGCLRGITYRTCCPCHFALMCHITLCRPHARKDDAHRRRLSVWLDCDMAIAFVRRHRLLRESASRHLAWSGASMHWRRRRTPTTLSSTLGTCGRRLSRREAFNWASLTPSSRGIALISSGSRLRGICRTAPYAMSMQSRIPASVNGTSLSASSMEPSVQPSGARGFYKSYADLLCSVQTSYMHTLSWVNSSDSASTASSEKLVCAA
jgi:hypothetical protein